MLTTSILTEDALKMAIRSAEEGETRQEAIQAAAELKLRELVPDNWADDGSLKAERAAEQRDTANDVTSGLESALQDALGGDDCGCMCDCYYLWVQDWMGGDEAENSYTVIYQAHGEMMSAPFSFDDDGKIAIDIEAAVKVRRITNFIERAKRKTAAWGAREQRQAKAEMLNSTWERRDWQSAFGTPELEVRAKSDGLTWVSGYASITERGYEVGYYEETIDRSAFKRTLAEKPDTVFLLNHAGAPLARTITDSLDLEADRKGLRYDAGLQPNDPDVQAIIPKLERKDLSESSFAFLVRDQEWDSDFTKRHILDVSLHKGDVSVVNYGANPATTAGMRALRALGSADCIVDMLLEFRAGKKLSSANEEALGRVLALVAEADESVDEAQPLLARVLGVENPDDTDEDEEPRALVLSSTSIARARRDRLMAGV